VLKHALVSGASASMVSTLVLAAGGLIDEGSAAGPINGPCQWVWGRREARTRRATLKHTLVGYLVHHASSVFWAIGYEFLFGRRRQELRAVPVPLIVLEAAAIAGCAYLCDYGVAPKRMRPGFRKHLGPAAIFASYAAVAVGLAAATCYRQRSSS
jgi:hypothetical protein